MATWIVGGIVLLAVGGIVWKMIADKRQGKHSCSGNCQSCHTGCASHTK